MRICDKIKKMLLANRGLASQWLTAAGSGGSLLSAPIRLDGRRMDESRASAATIEWLVSKPNESILRLTLGATM